MNQKTLLFTLLGTSASAIIAYFVYNKYTPSTPSAIQYAKNSENVKSAEELLIGKGSSDNDRELCSMSSEECECQYGFKRNDFKDTELIGTIDQHVNHVVLCTGTSDWPANVDEYQEGVGKLLSRSLKKLRKEVGKIKFTLSDAQPKGKGHDILIFPDMLRYNNVATEQLEDMVQRHFAEQKICTDLEHEQLKGVYIFVCAHTARDKRCGVCGPQLVKAFREALDKDQFSHFKNRVTVLSTSHVGGHKYAGNVVIYKKIDKDKYVGDWYGYVQPSDVDTILSEDVGKGKVVKSLWRGRGNLSQDMQRKLIQLF
eukprot:gb/GECH01004568.1/.p1 GENE.gb/GECH01004568.1/~~gb/GECH01004568.1/.p1  ORF type:complete len:313 (+),score=73.06 gb/GECH01004568.1/:1-939(+)